MITSALTALLLLLTACSGATGPSYAGSPESQTTTPPLSKPSLRAELLPGIVAPGEEPEPAVQAQALLHVERIDPVPTREPVQVKVTRIDGGRSEVVAADLNVPVTGVGLAVDPGTETAPAEYTVERLRDGVVVERPAHVTHLPWQTALDDEFSGHGLDQVWQVRESAELETCERKVEGAEQHGRNRDAFDRDMVRVTGGVAVVGVTDRVHSQVCSDGRILRRSGHIGTETTRTFSGSRFVIAARIRMPQVDGPHVAFWMRGTGSLDKTSTRRVPTYEDMAEMDIAEFFGPESPANCNPGGLVADNDVVWADWSKIQSNFYYNWTELAGFRDCVGRERLAGSGSYGAGDSWEEYHVYAVDWVPNRYYRVWYDGSLVRTFSGPELSSGRESFLALSHLINDGEEHYTGPSSQMAITLNGKEYRPGSDYLTPQDLSAMKVDWVRVWRPGGAEAAK